MDRNRLNKVSMQNLLTEIEVMKDLDHPHIVKLLDFEVRCADNGAVAHGYTVWLSYGVRWMVYGLYSDGLWCVAWAP